MKIINKAFTIGETYRSDVNGDIFEVIAIRTSSKPYSGMITFKHRKTGKTYECGLPYARRLLHSRPGIQARNRCRGNDQGAC